MFRSFDISQHCVSLTRQTYASRQLISLQPIIVLSKERFDSIAKLSAEWPPHYKFEKCSDRLMKEGINFGHPGRYIHTVLVCYIDTPETLMVKIRNTVAMCDKRVVTYGEVENGNRVFALFQDLHRSREGVARKAVKETSDEAYGGGKSGCLSGGGSHSLMAREEGGVRCFGRNGSGEAPLEIVEEEREVVRVSAGMDHSSALTPTGEVLLWGSNKFGQTPPGGFPGQRRYRDVSAGTFFTVALDTDGDAHFLGDNFHNQAPPDGVKGPFVAASAGWYHVAFLREDKRVQFIGRCGEGEDRPPAGIQEGSYTSVSSGRFHSAAVGTDGRLTFWGDNSDGQAPPEGKPGSYVEVSCGGLFTLARDLEGRLHAWGYNDYGQTDVPQGEFVAIAAGCDFGLALRADGSVVGFGCNDEGQAPRQSVDGVVVVDLTDDLTTDEDWTTDEDDLTDQDADVDLG